MGQLIPKGSEKAERRGAPGTTYVRLPRSSPKLFFVDFKGSLLHRLDSVDMEVCLGSNESRGSREDNVCWRGRLKLGSAPSSQALGQNVQSLTSWLFFLHI